MEAQQPQTQLNTQKRRLLKPALSLSINLLGGVGGPQPFDFQSEPSDMRGGFGSLAQQGFLAGFSARERSEQEKPVSAKKIPKGAF